MGLNGKRVLIVEDNLSNKAIVQALLEREGAKVFVDRWGKDATERLRLYAPVDLILLDLMLPGQVSGFDVFKQIRQRQEFAGIPIVAVSAADATTAIPQAQALGFAGFISKPIDFLLFTQQVQRILSGETLWITTERL